MINGDVVQITEVLERSVQGRTHPFLCRGADRRLYYVKGAGAGRKGLISEWLGSTMAACFGLPIAEHRIVEVPESMTALHIPDFFALGPGLAFGSVVQENVVDLSWSNIQDIPPQVRRDIAVFDWWVQNEDRTLSERAGNPNLLWHILEERVIVIDDNLAFDKTFGALPFWQLHAFGADWNDVFQDFLARPVYERRMVEALSQFEMACDKMPDDWLELGPGIPSPFTPRDALDVLERVHRPGFRERL
ncbi:MAG: HipA family kinase [Pararobbsia sp.]